MRPARRRRGFTLIEVMIAVAILAILASVALPSYQSYIRKTRRADAMNKILEVASRQEQFMLNRMTYTTDMTQLGFPADPVISDDGFYTVDAAACGTGAGQTIARCFVVTATPRTGRPQAADTQCTSFSLTSTGVRSATGTLGAACWP